MTEPRTAEPAAAPFSVISPGTFEWTLRNGRRQETRVYEQTELSIEGEARLVGMGRKMGAALTEAGYSWGQLGELFDENAPVDWDKVTSLLAALAEQAPDLIAETVAILLNLFPTNEDGSRNDAYLDEVLFLRGAINISRFTDMLRVFVATNDYERLVGPFSETLSGAMAAFGGPVSVGSAGSSGPSGTPAIVGTDGSTVELDLSPATPTGGEAQPSDSEWQSKDSPKPTSLRTRAPRKSAVATKPGA